MALDDRLLYLYNCPLEEKGHLLLRYSDAWMYLHANAAYGTFGVNIFSGTSKLRPPMLEGKVVFNSKVV